jgi:hypothetical protein
MAPFRKLRTRLRLRKSPTPQYVRRPNHRPPVDVSDEMGRPFRRRPDIGSLITDGGVGIELGVAKGWFSHQLLLNSKLAHLFSVDRWDGDRGHGLDEYKAALRLLLPMRERSTCLRMFFDEALDLFPDGYFDFIYIDGYAHTGQESGRTLADWWPKLKAGGLFAGDDYSDAWPLVMKEVDEFAASHDLRLMVLTPERVESPLSHHPSWLAFKT